MLMLSFSVPLVSTHVGIGTTPCILLNRMAVPCMTETFDALLAAKDVPSAVKYLVQNTDVDLSTSQSAALLDAACEASVSTPSAAEPDGADAQRKQQGALKAVYDALAGVGSLRGYGSVSAVALLPAGIESKEVTSEDQLMLTGLPTSAFAPPGRGSRADLLLGGGSAVLLSAVSSQLGIDVRYSLAAVGGALLLDSLLFRGAIAESATRAVKPGYATTVREHEAGHFLAAYLLGCPIEACLLDVWKAATDRRFNGAAGTVFFDPALGAAMSGGTINREIIDRYSVVVMAGIAAEAAQNGKAEGGQADEAALVTLLASLDSGRSWDLPRIRNQARWASSQALLLLREHGAAYKNLCEALERGEGVGGCVVAIEEGLSSAFGRNGELPAETRQRQLMAKRMASSRPEASPERVASMGGAMAAPAAATSSTASGGSASAASGADEARQAQIAMRLAEIKEQLARQEETWIDADGA